VSFIGHQCEPPETTTGGLDDGVIGVVEDCKLEGAKVDALELELVLAGVVVVAAVVPGMV
jgi:hypothetical protein